MKAKEIIKQGRESYMNGLTVNDNPYSSKKMYSKEFIDIHVIESSKENLWYYGFMKESKK